MTWCAVACSPSAGGSVGPTTPSTAPGTSGLAPGPSSTESSDDCVATVVPAASLLSPALPVAAIILHAGDSVCLVPAANGVWTATQHVDAQSPHLSLRMTAEDGKTMLQARNRTARSVHYRAAMQLPGNPDWEETSIIPVRAGLLGFELWPHPIEALAVFAVEAQ